MTDILKIATRNLLRYKRRTLLTSLLITVGLVAVMLFVAIAGSFKSMMVGQFTDSMVGHMQVHRRGYVGAMESLPVDRNMRPRMLVKLYRELDNLEGIEAWSPRVKMMAMFSNFASTTSIRMNGVDPVRELATVPLVANRVLEGGQVTPLVERGKIQVPELIAKGMKVKVGDTVVLVATNKKGSVNGRTFLVRGILESISGPGGRDGYMHIDDARALLRMEDEEVEAQVLAEHDYVTLAPEPREPDVLKLEEPLKAPEPADAPAAQSAADPAEEEWDIDAILAGAAGPGPPERAGYLAETKALFAHRGWGRPAEVSEIAIRLEDPGMRDVLRAALTARVADIKNKRNMSIFQVHPWQKFVPFSKIAKMIDLMTLFIKIILISVVLISVMNVLLMAVYERIREIGTMSAIGTGPGTVLSLFVSEGFLLGLLGTVVGSIVSLSTVWILNAVTLTFSFGRQENLVLAPTIAASDVMTIALLTILVAALASLQPAWKASRMDPIIALRHV
uniref:FtsX-like permease family protein n=1 Tax=Candidatus Kentrum eta TaxID=2126337 RepID=A0A450U7T4_9GAMM|nr:MAG: FtsX-like permease family protein [Candidatus Kentron sp. H]VFJ89539.1 MAG: FtsX-like permease family protein [Candidatus Kentron sp. H]VFJ96228.1 MAG: FtsX-like permease family protein [Candidatus Kentron sp. H]